MSDERFGMPGSDTRAGGIGSTPSGIVDSITFPSGTFDTGEDRFGMTPSMGMGGGGIGGILPDYPTGSGSTLDMTVETITVDIDFVASSSEDVIISMGSEVRFLIFGRVYIDADPGAAFNQWCQYTFYNSNGMKGSDAYYRNVVKITYTELETATTGSDTNIIPDDHTVFAEQDIAKFLDDGEMARLETITDTMIAEDVVGAHSIDTGLVRVSEFSGLTLFNMDGGSLTHARIEFGSPQTVNLKMELVLVQ